jgi:hypothetical protein
MEGGVQYDIHRIEKRRTSLKENPYKLHRAIWFYENFFLDVHYPKGLDVRFLGCGVTNDWSEHSKAYGGGMAKPHAEYKGLIFSRQGYMLLLSKK